MPGDSPALAIAICGQAFLPPEAHQYHPQAAIGMVPIPPFWNPRPDTYTLLYILKLVIFYNDDFCIVAGDSLPTRKEKLRVWLTEGV